MSLPLPDFYETDRVKDVYLERGALVADAARAYARRHGVKPAGQDRFRIAAFGIDCQVGFCAPGASLFVPGAVEDMQRATTWIYGNLERITGLHFSMDTHRVFQIFHPAWWTDASGNPPPPFTPIRHDDVRSGKWTAISHPRESLEYTRRLESSGKYVLTVWPFHTLLGGISHALMPAVMEAAIFHSMARLNQTHFETKGTHALTENYSVLAPEVKELGGQPVGAFNAPFFKLLMEFDRVYIFGEAKSHCVLSTIQDIQTEIRATDPRLADKVYILEDAMSPVPPPPITPLPPELDFPRIAERAIQDFRAAGMHVVKTTDPVTP
jgi:nicotinamidase-related amidase